MHPCKTFAIVKSLIKGVSRRLERNRIERLYYEGGDSRKMTYRPCVVCMIDICNYSRWCDKTDALTIFAKMTEYNRYVNNILKSYNLLEKIELVGRRQKASV